MVNGFKDGRTLLEEMRESGRLGRRELPLPEAPLRGPRRRGTKTPSDTSERVCECFTVEGCSASLESVKRGLSKTVFLCQGLIPPECEVRKKTASGVTVMDLFNK